ncbi:ribonuclease HII [Methylibium petroleiphilum]|uniref:Ribonuclease HII 1 n=1 Tax=Methylibium petroleiphilum (strain ATCC BAA-1232 / LMG 22953 / PM1) TaxID=420662 RepID=RNH21_METPP|nr:ribonuclease HII [Methylibium petroleiphilum]A2SMZ3.1 RecName: Full=Ribonuclease HII 1; Short=RNase HII 1 [Methylibium petroleiphilum PM1]ABM96932.1 RNase HII [Methylibium petroleiphilum PM1]
MQSLHLELTAGVDEAGRGPLAGPVVAAAVILDPSRPIDGLNDSKQLSAKRRDRLFDLIIERAAAYCIAEASVEEIDRLNILQATMLAMQRAIAGLSVTPQLVLIDGNRSPLLPMRSEAIVKGDARVTSIGAASILAKVHRDRLCAKLHETFPLYGFAVHKGYGTADHLAALVQHGACPEHRRTFSPVRAALARAAAHA